MRLIQWLQENAKRTGTYVGLRLSKKCADKVEKLQKDYDIPNPVPKNKLHTTLIFSRKKLIKFKPRGHLRKKIKAKAIRHDYFGSNEDDALVIVFDSVQMTERHQYIVNKHGATHDFDDYTPHITLSYNVEDVKGTNYDKLVEDMGELEFVEEYSEPLKSEWSKNIK